MKQAFCPIFHPNLFGGFRTAVCYGNADLFSSAVIVCIAEDVIEGSSRNGLTMKRQIGFAEAEIAGKKRVTRRQRFLAEMEKVVPWQRLLSQSSRTIPRAREAARRLASSECSESTSCMYGPDAFCKLSFVT